MPELTLTMPKPHRAQAKILREMRRFNVVSCGRRFGKTVLGEHRLIPRALDGFPTGWFAPSYKYLSEVWRDFKRILDPVIAESNKTDWRIGLITGGSIEFWSLQDLDAGRSRKYKHVVIDEAAKVKGLETAWTQAIRPTLADYRGSADFYSTPKGKDYFWQLFQKGVDPLKPDWACWTMPTSANPFIHPEEVLDLKASLPERVFLQEIMAAFHDDGGGVFRKVAEAVDVGRTLRAEPPKGHLIYSQGSDLARTLDFSVNDVLGPDGRQVFFDRYQQMSWTRQIELIAGTSRTYNNAAVTFDSTAMGGDVIHEALRKQRMGVICPFNFSNSSKEALIDNLALMFEQGKIRLIDVPEQTAELQAFEYEVLPSRKVRMQAPEGMHDDCVIGLALAAWGMGKSRKRGFY
jgi:hypothetical protein